MTEKISFQDQLITRFEERLPFLFGDPEARKAAALLFSEKGFPTRRTEDYKYIAPDILFKKEYGFRADPVRILTEADVKKLSMGLNAYVLVILNGAFIPELSSISEIPPGIIVHNLADAVHSDETAKAHYGRYAQPAADPFIALNTALNEGGIFIHILKDAPNDRPLHILHITDNATETFLQPRNLVVLDDNAEAVLIESFETIGPVKSFNNALTEIALAPNAILDHYRVQWEGQAGHLLSTVQANVSAGALYNTFTFTLGGVWVRNNLNVVLSGKKAETHLFGLYLLSGNQVCDNHTVVDHTVPDCMSNELYKGVMNGKSTGIFNGKIFVRPDAQKTNAFQTNRNILLSDDATINTKPQLEIYADDVKCSHGTSTGRIDEEALFYLRTRGIAETHARKLLIRAFAEEVVDQVEIDLLKEYIETRIDDILQ
ncbi:MAG TPA: Fe-S cluster assembly protein SufD [Bacteroidia bacterium]|nr:Fe-S cluster assembly protein SufD [Bacteroidia bacterium]